MGRLLGSCPAAVTLSELELSPSMLRAFAFAWGAVWGSFLNVVIYRVPRELSVVRPGSHCPGCGKPIALWDNIPILSWLLLRGRARCCGVRISPRYFVVELVAGLIGLAVLEAIVMALPPETGVYHATTVFLADFGLAMGLLAAAFIDLEHMYLPDSITLGGTLIGLATPGLRGLTWVDVIVGAGVGFVGVWLPFVVGYQALRGRAGMGLGDAKLTMLAGAWFGWPGVVFAVFAGALQATVAAVVVLVAKGKIEEPESVVRDRQELQKAADAGDEEARQMLADDPLGTAPGEGVMAARLPFGPFLCLALLEWMLAGPWIADRWLPWMVI
jgi:leader peptidase (prepilin peptidase)/N-methyltransferase